MGVGKAPNRPRAGLGFRVYKPRVSRVNRERLKALYNDVINYILGVVHELKGSKYLTYYAEEWKKIYENAKRMRREAGKRTPPKAPPLPLPVRFVMPDGSVRGDRNAPAVIDLRKGELRVPSYGVVQRLPRSLVRALVEENNLNPRPDFVLQVTRKGLVRLIASRAPPRKDASALLLVCMDENLGHGLYTTLIRFDGEKVKVARGPTFKPPNAALLRRIAARLQSAADRGATSELRALIEKAYEELGEKREVEGGKLYATPDRLRELKRRIGARERRLNREWRNRVVAWLRRTMRANADARAVVLVDEVTVETAQSGMLRRVRRKLMNLCAYEGAEYLPLRASGKLCPRCGAMGVEVVHRVYRCPRCGLEWNRDRCATFALALNYAKITENEALRKALLEWLNEHPRALLS
ncbi:MAG: zinc ribbon domain-containing protein [Thermofilum sp.]|nr:zinc ribbon domain-containing protein [Thermofilum sp.]